MQRSKGEMLPKKRMHLAHVVPGSPSAEPHLERFDRLASVLCCSHLRSGDLLSPSPPAEKATACEDQAGKASTGDGAGDTTGGDRRIVVSLKAATTRVLQDEPSNLLPCVGMDVDIVCNLIG